MPPTIRNHYLPQFYLRNFVAVEYGHFWVYYKGRNEPIPQTPINTCVEKNLYNTKKDDGTIDDTAEREFFSPIEGDVSPILEEATKSDGRISKQHIARLALFLSVMATRVPASIEAAMEVEEALAISDLKKTAEKPEILQRFFNKLEQKGELPEGMTVDNLRDEIREFETRYGVAVDKKYATGLSLSATQAIQDEMLKMHWCLFEATSDDFFITSDCPLVCFVPRSGGTATFGGGFGSPDVEVSFPLSPTKCLYLVKKPILEYSIITEPFLSEINRRTAWSAHKTIISATKSDKLEALNQWASTNLNQPKLDRDWLLERFSKDIKGTK